MSTSADINWLLIRNNSCFIVKRNGVTLSREPGNLTNLNRYKDSFVANKRAVGIVAAPNKKGIVVETHKKNSKGATVNSITFSGKTTRAINKSIKNITSQYRPDLQAAALSRATALLKGQRPVKASNKKRGRSAKRV